MTTHYRRAQRATVFDERHPFSPATSAASRETLTESELGSTESLTASIDNAIKTGDWAGVAATARSASPTPARPVSNNTIASDILEPMRHLASAAFKPARDSSQVPTPASSRSDSSEFQFPARDYQLPSGTTHQTCKTTTSREHATSSTCSSRPTSSGSNSSTGSRPKRVVNISTKNFASSSRPVSRESASSSARDTTIPFTVPQDAPYPRPLSRESASSSARDTTSPFPASRDAHNPRPLSRDTAGSRQLSRDAPSSTARDATSSFPAARDAPSSPIHTASRYRPFGDTNSRQTPRNPPIFSPRDASSRPISRNAPSYSSRDAASRPASRDAPIPASQNAALRPVSRDASDPTSRSSSGSHSTAPSSFGYGIAGDDDTIDSDHIEKLMQSALQLNDQKCYNIVPKVGTAREIPLYHKDKKLPQEERKIMDFLENLRSQVITLKEDNAALLARNSLLEHENKQLLERNSLLDHENKKLQATNEANDDKLIDLEDLNVAICERNNVLKRENVQIQRYSDTVNDQVAELTTKNEKLVTQCGSANERANSLAEQVGELQAALRETTHQLQSMYVSQQQDAGLGEEIEQLRKQLAAEKDARMATVKSRETIVKDYKSLQKDYESSQKDQDAGVGKEIEQLRKQLAAEKDARTAIEESRETVLKEYESLQKDHKEVFVHFRTFKEDHAFLEKDNEKLFRENKDLAAEVAKLKATEMQKEKSPKVTTTATATAASTSTAAATAISSRLLRKRRTTITEWFNDVTITTA